MDSNTGQAERSTELSAGRPRAVFDARSEKRFDKRKLTLLAPLIPLGIVALVWWFADLSALSTPERVAESARALRDSPYGLLYVVAGFSIGTLLFLPVTALIAGTTLAYDPVHGFTFAMIGALVGASVNYWAGRLAGGAALDYMGGPRLARVRQELRTHAFRASAISRVLPLGNFTVINLMAGSLRVPFRSFFAGNVVGLIPGVLGLTLFADQITAILRDPGPRRIWMIAAFGLLVALMVLAVRWFAKRRRI